MTLTNKEITINNLKTALVNYTGDRIKFLKILEDLIGVKNIDPHYYFKPHESSKKGFTYDDIKNDFFYFFKESIYDLLPEDHLKKINKGFPGSTKEDVNYLFHLEKDHKKYYFLLLKIYIGLLIKNLEVFLKDIDLFVESFQHLIKFSSDDPNNLLKLDKNNYFCDENDQDYIEDVISEIENSIYDEEIELILKSIPFFLIN